MASRKKSKTIKLPPKGDKSISTDLEIISKLKEKFVEQLDAGQIKLKVGDLVKIFELQKQLSTDRNAEEKFWEMIEQIRQSEIDEDEDEG